MNLNSSMGAPGDKSALRSPDIHLDFDREMHFSYYSTQQVWDRFVQLDVKIVTDDHLDIPIYTISSASGTNVTSHTICLPSGDYQVHFVGTLGVGDDVHLALTDVYLGEQCMSELSLSDSGR